MSLAPDLVALLADPETHEALTLASQSQLRELQEAIAKGQAKRRDGKPVPSGFDGALLCTSGRVVYLIEAGIPNLLVDERVELTSALGQA